MPNIELLNEANKEISDLTDQLANQEVLNDKIAALADERINKLVTENSDLKQQVDRLTLANAGMNSRLTNFKEIHNNVADENNGLKAMVELYRRELVNSSETFIMLDDWTHPEVECDAPAAAIDELLDKTPRQCLANFKADVITEAANHAYAAGGKFPINFMHDYANKLREGES